MGGQGGEGGQCPELGPFQWTRAIGNDLQQFTSEDDNDIREVSASSIRVASIPGGEKSAGFYVLVTTDGILDLGDLGRFGDENRSLFVLHYDDRGSLLAARAHPQAPLEKGQPPLLLDDAVALADGTLVVSGRLGSDTLVLETPTGSLAESSSYDKNPDAFVAAFDADGYASNLIRFESTKQSLGSPATVRGLTPVPGGVLAVGGYRQGLRLNGAPHAALTDVQDDYFGFVMFLDGGDPTEAPVRVFQGSQAAIALTGVAMAENTVYATADIDLRADAGTIALSQVPSWVLVRGSEGGYPDQSLIIAMDEAFSPEWVTLLGSSYNEAADHLDSIAIDPENGVVAAVGSNITTESPPVVTTRLSRLFSLAGPSTSSGCNTSFTGDGTRAVVAALDLGGDCRTLDSHAGASAAHATIAAHGSLYIAGFAVPDSFEGSNLVEFDAAGEASGFLARSVGAQDRRGVYDGVLFGGSRAVRVDDVAATPDGLIVVGSMGSALLDLGCPGPQDFDLFVAKLSP